MKWISLCVPLLAITVCSVAVAEPKASRIGSEVDAPKISLVGFFGFRAGGGYGYGGDVAGPSCGVEPSCGAAPACGAEASCGYGGAGGNPWDGYCQDRHRHFGLFNHHRRGCCLPDVSCGCAAAAPSCGVEPGCAAAPACGADVADCGCGHRHHFGHGHRLCGHGGCFGGKGCGCGSCGYAHCRPFRFWANGWCGQVVDGWNAGNPPDCYGGQIGQPIEAGKMPAALPPEPMPMDEPMDAPPPPKSTRRLQWPGMSKLPIGAGIR